MRGYVANTDHEWYSYLRAIEPPIDEVNFWKPGSATAFKALQPGEPLFFKLKQPHHAIAGFGYFAHYSSLPVSMAWQVYGGANGAASFGEMRSRLARIRGRFGLEVDAKQDFWIGCILIHEPTFFDETDWVRAPSDFAAPIVQGKTYDLNAGEGERIWLECQARVEHRRAYDRPDVDSSQEQLLIGGYGSPMLVRPRLGQRSFRIAVLDYYGRRCAITNEKTLPALEAAHIREYSLIEQHSLNNGILFRADIHKLFDSGYVTVNPECRFEVSRKIKEEFENGREYYALHGSRIRLPEQMTSRPSTEALIWHNENRYLG